MQLLWGEVAVAKNHPQSEALGNILINLRLLSLRAQEANLGPLIGSVSI